MEVDRNAWADLISQLIQRETNGNKAAFARAVGVDRTTVIRWVQGTVDVSVESIHAVARALSVPAQDLLARVGYYDAQKPEDTTPAQALVDQTDAAIRLVQESDAPLDLKRELIAYLRGQREEHDRQRVAEAERLLRFGTRGHRRRDEIA